MCGAECEGDGTRVVDGPASLREAGPSHVSFYSDKRYRPDLESTRAAGVLVPRGTRLEREGGPVLLVCADSNAAFTRVVSAFVPPPCVPIAGVHASAVVDPTARIAASASIGPLCSIAAGCEIGEGAHLVAGVHLGQGARVGADSVLHPGVVLYAECSVGARCILHSGAIVGADGFGFEPTREGWKKIPQVGTALIEDEVEIGANVTIDRGRFGATRIGRGTKIDNLVHVAHNVVVGEGVLLIAQTGIAGSARIESRAIVAGQVGIAGHATIGAGARIGAQAGVFGDVPPGEDWAGYPARPRRESLRSLAEVQRLPKLVERVRALEERLHRIEEDRAE
ncbi:MAG: UDP-3-O-(3-hydroxymyristoyl)glucosamine N-acyltransferase [Planctomycetes bacterium]|nr:UDP-3-O-(3-hydroxymyristoyl)glucosamine N-acyltransferase [Planctomycetota bacterium]